MKTSKTAGTSVEMALEHACAPDGHVVFERTPVLISETGIIGRRRHSGNKRWFWPFMADKWKNHMPATEVQRALGSDKFAQFAKITTVRNPFDRCISVFHWRRENLVHPDKDFGHIRDSFQSFIKNELWKDDRKIVFIHNKYIIDHAIRFEHLQKDLASVAAVLGIKLPEKTPHTKSTLRTRKNYPIEDYYDQKTIDIVRKQMGWVFKHFEYDENPSCARVA